MTCTVNPAQKSIIVSKGASGGLPGPIPAGAQITFKLNAITNPKVQYNPPSQTPSFKVTSFYSVGGIDYVYD
jgi:hypothetical protein